MNDWPNRSPEVAKIAVLRPNAVGDFVFALPALHALKQAYPQAEIVYLGKAWHAAFLQDRPGPVDRVVVMPPVPGVGAPPNPLSGPQHDAPLGMLPRGSLGSSRTGPLTGSPPAPDNRVVERFVEQMRAERFDIVAQMFGGGRYSNPFVMRLGARLAIGACADDAMPLDRWVPYVEPGNRRLALLEIAALAGGSLPLMACELAVTPADRAAAAWVLPPHGAAPLVVLQPGSSDPRRCWPADRFAAVGDALAASGARIVVNGTQEEGQRVRQVVGGMRYPALDLTGMLGLGGLCALLERATLVVSNDTGPLHLALALGTPAVGIFWHTNLVDGAPLRPGLLRAAVSAQVQCPVCGIDNRVQRCVHQDSFVADVPIETVSRLALSLLHRPGARP